MVSMAISYRGKRGGKKARTKSLSIVSANAVPLQTKSAYATFQKVEWVPATPGGIVDPLISASMLPEHLRGSHSVFTGHVGDRGVDGFYSESLGENKVIE